MLVANEAPNLVDVEVGTFVPTAPLQHNRNQNPISATSDFRARISLLVYKFQILISLNSAKPGPSFLVSRRWDGNADKKRFEKPRRRS